MKNLVLINFNRTNCELIEMSVLKGFVVDDLSLYHNVNNEIDPQGQTVYITPGCNIPRHKVKSMGLITTIKPSKADSIIIPPHSYGDSRHFKTNRFVPLESEQLIMFMENACVDGYDIDAIEIEKSLKRTLVYLKAFVNVPNTIFGISHKNLKDYYWRSSLGGISFSKAIRNFAGEANTINLNLFDARNWGTIKADFKKKMEFITPVNKELFFTDKQYYTEDALLKIANSNKISITRENYLDWQSLAESQDEENKSLLMELMTNCDFESSIAFLCALMYNYGWKLRKIKGYDHIGFRSLLSYLDLHKADMRYLDLSKIENKIKNKNLWTDTVAEDLWWATQHTATR